MKTARPFAVCDAARSAALPAAGHAAALAACRLFLHLCRHDIAAHRARPASSACSARARPDAAAHAGVHAVAARHLRRFALLAIALLAIFLLAGCAYPARGNAQSAPAQQQAWHAWSGRLSLHVHAEPPQYLSGGFTLRGQPWQGRLSVTNPLGGMVADLAWSPRGARLRQGGRQQDYASLDEAMERNLGAALPVQALFAWLQGQPQDVPGWQVSVDGAASGRLLARRLSPQPAADLRIVFSPDVDVQPGDVLSEIGADSAPASR